MAKQNESEAVFKNIKMAVYPEFIMTLLSDDGPAALMKYLGLVHLG